MRRRRRPTSFRAGRGDGCLLILLVIVIAAAGLYYAYYTGVLQATFSPHVAPPPPPAAAPAPATKGHTAVPAPAPAPVATKPVSPQRQQRLAELRATPQWIEAKQKADALHAQVEAARLKGDPTELSHLSRQWMAAESAVGAMESDAVKDLPDEDRPPAAVHPPAPAAKPKPHPIKPAPPNSSLDS